MSVDFTKWSVQQMRDELSRLSGASAEEVNQIKGKALLAEKIFEFRPKDDESVDFSNVTYDDDDDGENTPASNEEVVNSPKIGSPGWQSYVLEHLMPDEWSEKNGKKFPKAAGLRRITAIICGPIVNSGPIQVWPPSGTNKSATVLYGISIMWTQGMRVPEWISEQDASSMSLPIRTFSEVADCSPENTPEPYCLHPSATAASKAEGRTFKKILQLNITTAEEMSVDEPERFALPMNAMSFDSDKISANQMTMISTLCSRLEIDVEKALIENGLPSSLQALSRLQASQMVVSLNRYQTNTEVSLDIPDIIKSN